MGVSSNLYLRVMQHKETFAKPSLGKNNSKVGGEKKQLSLIRPVDPEFKTLHRPGDGR